MTTTAERIETAEQLALVKAEGCTDLQGCFFSRPMLGASIVDFLRGLTGQLPQQAGLA